MSAIRWTKWRHVFDHTYPNFCEKFKNLKMCLVAKVAKKNVCSKKEATKSKTGVETKKKKIRVKILANYFFSDNKCPAKI